MHKRGFTLVEILITIGIMLVMVGIIFASFNQFRASQGLEKDTETIVEILQQARAQTLSSKNATAYGVHFASTTVTMFTGSSYSVSDPNNQVFSLISIDTIFSLSLTGGGTDVVFQRLTGETSQSGTITLTSQGTTRTRTITIYKTGLVQYQ
ncbi:MAG: seg [Candidatus Paceibacter sp.]|jgi:prepilin-type N-terminal cleavage/methylation domain-containing protein|nr:seg [Candidatus Paceibacter sp.]